MCRGISILKARIRQELFEQYELGRLEHRRAEGADEELWFDFADRGTSRVMLPVIHDGQIVLYEWGNRSGKSKLPKTGWCKRESLEAGVWGLMHPRPVVIPATYGLEKGIWFPVTEGIQGIAVGGERGNRHVYMLTEPASHYYNVMTRHDRMPVLIGERL